MTRTRRDPYTLCQEVALLVGHDGTGDLRVIVDQALRDNPRITARAIANIVVEARTDWALERDRDR